MNINENIRSQYQASLAMLQQVITQCPENMWGDKSYRNVF